MKYGRLEILTVVEGTKENNYRTICLCRCDCGTLKTIRLDRVKSGKTVSCGCYGKEQRAKANKTHGMSKHPLQGVFNNMKARCYNKRNPSYHNYGGRGISICKKWRKEKGAFFDWCFKNGWAEGLQLGRIDNNGNYKPSNCHFVNQQENLLNKNKKCHLRK